MSRRLLRFLLGFVSILLLLSAVSLWGLYRAAQTVPDFYLEAINQTPADRTLGNELEKRVIELNNDVAHDDYWEAEFTDDQINGWLADDLRRKFPGLLPAEVEDPRVVFEPDLARIACRVNANQLTTVLSFDLKAQLTDHPNELAIQLTRARAGRLPLPLAKVLDTVSEAARAVDVALRWSKSEGDPVAVLRWNTGGDSAEPSIVIRTIEIQEGRIHITGATLSDEHAVVDHPSLVQQ